MSSWVGSHAIMTYDLRDDGSPRLGKEPSTIEIQTRCASFCLETWQGWVSGASTWRAAVESHDLTNHAVQEKTQVVCTIRKVIHVVTFHQHR